MGWCKLVKEFHIFLPDSTFTLQTEIVTRSGKTSAWEEDIIISTPKYAQTKKHLLIAFFSLSFLVILGFLILVKIHLTKHCQKRIILSVWIKTKHLLFKNYFWLIIFIFSPHLVLQNTLNISLCYAMTLFGLQRNGVCVAQ